MAAKPWLTSDDLVQSVKLNIMFPISQSTFTADDILSFANKEMATSQVPSILQFHEEFFVSVKLVPLVSNQSVYPIPDRAIGLKLRDLYYRDTSNNLTEMTRITGDEDIFTYGSGSGTPPYKYKLEGNDIVLVPPIGAITPTGSLVFVYYLRPNQLVANRRAAIVSKFTESITVNNASISPGDTITVNVIQRSTDSANTVSFSINLSDISVLSSLVFTAVSSLGGTITAITPNIINTIITSANHQLTSGQSVVIAGSDSTPTVNGTFVVTVIDANNYSIPVVTTVAGTTGTFTSPNQFLIGATSLDTASNMVTTINTNGTYFSGNGIPATNTVQIQFQNLMFQVQTSNTAGFNIFQATTGISFVNLPTTDLDPNTGITTPLFANGASIDFLQTKPGHKIRNFDVIIPNNGVTTNAIEFNINDVPLDLQIGDYICLSNECIIPQIPSDLHEVLSERTSARIQKALGDQAGLQATKMQIQEMEGNQAKLIDNRAEGTPQKILGRHTIMKIMARRRSHLRGW